MKVKIHQEFVGVRLNNASLINLITFHIYVQVLHYLTDGARGGGPCDVIVMINRGTQRHKGYTSSLTTRETSKCNGLLALRR